MGNELPLARKKRAGRRVLLAGLRSGGTSKKASRRNKRKEEGTVIKDEAGETITIVKKKGKDSLQIATSDASSTGQAGHRRGHKARKSDRGVEGQDKATRRSAKELGIVWFDYSCSDSPTKAHCMMAIDTVDGGDVFKCIYCHRCKWLPRSFGDAEKMSNLMRTFGMEMGYQKMLDRHPAARVLIAKLQDLWYLRKTIKSDEDFVQVISAVMGSREYDKERR